MDEILWLLGTIMVVAAAGAFATFVVWYARINWRETPIGRHLMAFMATLSVVILYALFANFFETPQAARAWVRFVAWGAVAVVGWWRVYLFIRIERDGRAGKLPRNPIKRKEWK